MSKWQENLVPRNMKILLGPSVKIYSKDLSLGGFLEVFVTIENGKHHLSICHKMIDSNKPGRYPTWDEIHEARYKFLPNEITVAMLLPPKEEYVNLHNTTFHLWEIDDE